LVKKDSMHILYILFSKSLNKYYVGEINDVDRRLDLHNNHYNKKAFTKSASDWELYLSKECENKIDVLYLEKFNKKRCSLVLPTLRDWMHHNKKIACIIYSKFLSI